MALLALLHQRGGGPRNLGYLTVLNTVLALCGSTLATYVFSKLIRGKIEVEDIANAALAGGVCHRLHLLHRPTLALPWSSASAPVP